MKMEQVTTVCVIFLSVFYISVAEDNEPFSLRLYDILEKMAKFEDKMDKWEKEREIFQETVLSILEHRKDEMKSLIGAQNENLQSRIEEYEVFRDQITNRTQKIFEKHDAEYENVAFNAYTTTSAEYYDGQVVKFPTASLNAGGGFNTDTGYFTTPVSGLYHFSVHICNVPGKYTVASIVHENVKIAVTTEYESVGSSCSSLGVPILLNSGEKVWVKSVDTRSVYADSLSRWASFSGFLVHLQNV